MTMSASGQVFNIQRFSLHDGPGIRTTVFLKGCPLRCQWCHNPEGLDPRAQVRLNMHQCVHCGHCAEVCEHGCHTVTADTHAMDRSACDDCGKCVEECPYAALEVVGEQITVDGIMSVVARDLPFYEQSGGGMTLSGGEPMMQFEFTRSILTAAKAAGLHTALETTSLCAWDRLQEIRPLVDLFLVDLKHTDDTRHRELTGVSNKQILANIHRMVAAGWPVRLRIPFVPQRNAEPSFLSGIDALLASMPAPPPVEFLLYHRLASGKWASLGGEPTMPPDIPAATLHDVAPWVEALTDAGYDVSVG
ncbi:MAG TPA: glycyl-radical enzyme activating protein [Capsulimonadaceae bacterium]|jgi:pyruvate formate lyase activating enzyme